MNSKNKQQKWIENHPVAWWIMNKVGDFLWFYAKFSLCMLLTLVMLRLKMML